MLKKNYMLSLLLLATLASAPAFSVYSAPVEDEKKAIELEKKEKHEHKKGDSCPLSNKKSPKSCPIARKKVQDKLQPKKTGWDKWFGKEEGKDKKDAKKVDEKKHHTARPSKSWWKFWGTETTTGGTHDPKTRARLNQERRSELKRSGKSFDKKKMSKRAGKKGSKKDKRAGKKRGKKDAKKKSGRKHGKKKNGKKRDRKRDKKRDKKRAKNRKKDKKNKEADDSKKAIIEVK